MSQESAILRELSQLAGRMFVNGGGAVYLYGSRARGDAGDNSDWDILIITDDNISTNDDFRRFAFPYAEIGWRFGQQITPIHFTRSQWDAQDGTLFHHNVRSEAIRL